MRVLVLCDSEYGNTWKLAEAMANALRPHAEEVTTVKASEASALLPAAYDLVLVGGPTQGHGISPRLKTVLTAIPKDSLKGVSVLVFDTRMHMIKLLTGSAAESAARTLKSLGAELLLPPESFFVKGTEGPLDDGEVERAAGWVGSPKVLDALHAPVPVT